MQKNEGEALGPGYFCAGCGVVLLLVVLIFRTSAGLVVGWALPLMVLVIDIWYLLSALRAALFEGREPRIVIKPFLLCCVSAAAFVGFWQLVTFCSSLEDPELLALLSLLTGKDPEIARGIIPGLASMFYIGGYMEVRSKYKCMQGDWKL